ncbi:MAG TPA: hypothetical protein VGD17_00980 [Chitinophagaceae bacterium]
MLICFLLLAILQQDPSASIKQIESQLSKGSINASAVLSNESYMPLHTYVSFRELIKKYAKAAPLKIVTPAEKGTPAIIKGKLLAGNKASADMLVYVYQTDNRGWYNANQQDGQTHSRLFGYVKTNAQGEFEFHTIRPASYPNSTLPQHIHVEVYAPGGERVHFTELLFDDDPNLKGDTRQRYINEGYVVAKNSGTKDRQEFNYVVRMK